MSKRDYVKRFVAGISLVALFAGPAGPAGLRAAEPKDEGGDEKGVQRIGLKDALGVAVKQNPTLAVETVDLGIADARIEQTYGIDDWLIDAGVNWSSNRSEPVSGQPFQTTAFDRGSLNAGVSKNLADGGRIGLRFDGNYNRQVSLVDIQGFTGEQTSEVYAPGLSVSFYQPLLKGFGEKNRNGQRAIERNDRSTQELERENAAGTVVRDVVQAYWDLAYAAQELEIRKQSLALAKEQLRITRAAIDVGKLPRTDALAVEQAIALREEEVLLAEQAVSDRAIELRRLTGLPIGPGDIDLVATDRLDVTAKVPELDAVLERAMENNPQLRIARQQQKGLAIGVELTDNGLLPTLDFSASAGPSGNGDDLGEGFSQMVTFDSYNVQAGVTFSMVLGNRGAEGAREVAKGNLRKAKLTEQDIKAQIAAQVVRALNLVKSAAKRIEVAAKASQLAQQNVEVEKARWEVGRTTNFEVLRRQDELAYSQLREARARADYLKAVSTLDWLTGDLLAKYGIGLQ